MRQWAVLLIFCAACGDSNPCLDALDARTSCLAQAGVSVEVDNTEQLCSVYGLVSEVHQELNDWASCQAEAFDKADCTDPLQVAQALEEADACGSPLGTGGSTSTGGGGGGLPRKPEDESD